MSVVNWVRPLVASMVVRWDETTADQRAGAKVESMDRQWVVMLADSSAA